MSLGLACDLHVCMQVDMQDVFKLDCGMKKFCVFLIYDTSLIHFCLKYK